jgi:hypothetical protein
MISREGAVFNVFAIQKFEESRPDKVDVRAPLALGTSDMTAGKVGVTATIEQAKSAMGSEKSRGTCTKKHRLVRAGVVSDCR